MSIGMASEPVIFDSTTWRGRALVPVLIFVGLMTSAVSSLGAPLIPTIAIEYDVSLSAAQWVLTITLLVATVGTPIIGRLGDGPRRTQVLLLMLGVLVAGSGLAALPVRSFPLLLIARAMQGLGVSLLPLMMSIARDHLRPEKSRSALATLSVTAVVGVGLGYPLTGLLVERLSLHDAFGLVAILGVVAVVLVALVVPAGTHRRSESFDLIGAITLGLGLTALLLAISEGVDWGWGSAKLLVTAAAGVLFVSIWIGQEVRTEYPLVDLSQMRNPVVLTANVTAIVAGLGLYLLVTMDVRYVQTPASTGYGLSGGPILAGATLLPFSIVSLVASKLVVYLARRITVRAIVLIGILAIAASQLMFVVARAELWELFVVMGLAGIGMGFYFSVLPRLIVRAVPASRTGSVLAMNQVLRTSGFAIGSALAATILSAHTGAGSAFPTDRGYSIGAIVGIVCCLFAAALSRILPLPAASAQSASADNERRVEQSADAAFAGTIAFEPEHPSQDEVMPDSLRGKTTPAADSSVESGRCEDPSQYR